VRRLSAHTRYGDPNCPQQSKDRNKTRTPASYFHHASPSFFAGPVAHLLQMALSSICRPGVRIAGSLYLRREISVFESDKVPVQEQQCRKGLVLRRSADLLVHSHMCEECVDSRFRHLRWAAIVMKIVEPFDPAAIDLLCASTVMP
jgi:hypothetical protein